MAFQILLVGSLFFILASVNNMIISSMNEPKAVTKIILYSALLNVGLNLFMIPLFGINGAAFSTTAAYALSLVLSNHKLMKSLGVKSPYLQWAKLSVAAAVFVMIIVYLTKMLNFNFYIELVISTLLACLVYASLLYLFNIIDFIELKKHLLKVFKK